MFRDGLVTCYYSTPSCLQVYLAEHYLLSIGPLLEYGLLHVLNTVVVLYISFAPCHSIVFLLSVSNL